MEVHNVFLHGDLDEESYAKSIKFSYYLIECGLQAKLKNSLYGLQQVAI